MRYIDTSNSNTLTNKELIKRLIYYLSKKRTNQLKFLIVSVIINGFFEAFSIISLMPFLSILSDPNSLFSIKLVSNIASIFGIYSSKGLLLPISFLFSLLVLISTSIRLYNIWFLQRFVAFLDIELSSLLMKKNLYQSYSNYIKQNSSEIIGLILDQSSAASSAIINFLNIFVALTLALSIIFSLVFINWKVVLISIFIFTIYYFLITKKIKFELEKSSSRVALLENMRIKVIQEAFGGFRDIIINASQELHFNLFKDYQTRVKLSYATSDWAVTFPKYFLESFIIILGTWVGFSLAIGGNKSSEFIPLMGTYVYGVLKLLPNIQQIYSGWARFKFKYESLKKFINGLDKVNVEVYPINKDLRQIDFKKSIEFNNVSFLYENINNSSYVLKNINLTINKGEHLGIVGSTGSGKSTFLDLIMGLLKPSDGNIYIDGKSLQDINNINLLRWRKTIAHVPQNIYLVEGSIAENIAFGENFNKERMQDIEEAADKAKILNFIRKTDKGFQTNVGERGINLSGGQRQRIAIARALFRKKKVLILDEATSSLDIDTEKSIIKTLKDLSKDLTIITVTHRLQSLEYCNRVIKIAKNNLYEMNDS